MCWQPDTGRCAAGHRAPNPGQEARVHGTAATAPLEAVACGACRLCRQRSVAGGFGEAARSAGVAGWVAGAEGEANPSRVPMTTTGGPGHQAAISIWINLRSRGLRSPAAPAMQSLEITRGRAWHAECNRWRHHDSMLFCHHPRPLPSAARSLRRSPGCYGLGVEPPRWELVPD